MAGVNTTSLQETAIRYQKDFMMLPYFVLSKELGLLGINLVQGVQNKDTITNFLRKNGITKPYDPAAVTNSTEIAKVEEVTMIMRKAYASVKDSIQNYKSTLVGPDVLLGKNQSKKHPWEKTMIATIVKTFGEEVLSALFSATFDLADQTPQGLFDGYNKIITAAITGGAIAAGKGNLFTTGALNNSVVATNVFDKLLAMYRASDVNLRTQKSIFMVPFAIGDAYDDAYFEKYKSKPNYDEFGRTVLSGSNGLCLLKRSSVIGGGRVILTAEGNFDFGMDTMSDAEFVQVRYPFEDPNLVQFWIQADFGTRIRSFHKKVFMTNEQAGAAVTIAGDY